MTARPTNPTTPATELRLQRAIPEWQADRGDTISGKPRPWWAAALRRYEAWEETHPDAGQMSRGLAFVDAQRRARRGYAAAVRRKAEVRCPTCGAKVKP